MKVSNILFVSMFAAFSMTALGETPDQIMNGYLGEAKVKAFSAETGKAFFHAEQTDKKGEKVSCATCHSQNPMNQGKSRVGKVIEPMAVAANNKRFTDKAKVEKWFKRNCKDVYERECTAKEKGDFIAFMKSAK